MEGGFFLTNDLNHIRNGKGPAPVSVRMVKVEHLVHFFQGTAFHLALKHLVVDLAAKRGRALKALQIFVVQEGHIVLVPVWVDLINCNVHVRSRSFLSLISPTRIFSSSFTSFPREGGSS